MTLRSLSLLLLLLLSTALVACTPRGSGGGDDDDAADDDDSAADDDDAVDDDDSVADDDDSVADDDDAVGDDDDATFPPQTTCPGGYTLVTEVEPNDGEKGVKSMQDIGPQGTGFCVEGSAVCGNDGKAFTAGLDFLVFQATSSASVEYTFSWAGAATDMDGVVQEVDSESILHEFEIGTTPETGAFSLTSGNTYLLRVGCWEGQDSDWLAVFAF